MAKGDKDHQEPNSSSSWIAGRPGSAPPRGAGGPRSSDPAQTSVYFDTDKGKVRKAGYSLRVRQAATTIQTVKTNGGGAGLFDRDEWETPVRRHLSTPRP